MNFKITTFKLVFSIIIGILAAGLEFGFVRDCFPCPHKPSYLPGIIAFILVAGFCYTFGSLTQKKS